MFKQYKKVTIFLTFLLIISGILYALANRYLIEHVEVSDVEALEESMATASGTTEETDTAQNSAAAQSNDATQNNDTNINVTKVVTGEGNNQVTYYVADVQLGDATDLKSAFAKNAFGTNIIDYPSSIAEDNNAFFAINGDYYGFRDDGIIIRNGIIYRDIPARTGLAFYSDGHMAIYDETSTSAEELLEGGVINTYSFGPALLEDGNIVEGIDSIEVDTNFGNHSIQGSQPRTGIGMIDANHFIFIVVDGRSTGYSKGVTLPEFAEIFKSYGCTEAYNIDGGGSSTMYYNGSVINNPLGRNKERGTSDIIYIEN